MAKKRYLIQITRATRAERPDEATVLADSLKTSTGDFENMSQDAAKDNFFVFSGDPQFELMRILSTMPFNPYALTAGDGYRVIPYPHGGGTGGEARENSQIQVQYTTEDSGGLEIVNSVAEGLSWIGSNLDGSDGYILIDENETSVVLYSRPSLWINEESNALVTSTNLHGRDDSDRV